MSKTLIGILDVGKTHTKFIAADADSGRIAAQHERASRSIEGSVIRALDVVGPKRLLFGTDSSFFPRGWHHQIFDEQATALYEIGLSEADARSIFSENLLRIIGR